MADAWVMDAKMSAIPFIMESPTEAVPRAIAALRASGVSVTESQAKFADQVFVCRSARHQVEIWIHHDAKRPGIDFIEVSDPPWSWQPWRWRGDYALFDCICAAFFEEPFKGCNPGVPGEVAKPRV